jgi:fructose-bisphosphate aldolase, class I
VFSELHEHGVWLEGMLLKPNMVLSGYACREQAAHEDVARSTICCLRRHVPVAVPGIVFLSGGQSDEDATARLSALNARGRAPWELSFSYGRALQGPALRAWGGSAANVAAAQAALLHRVRMNGAARSGTYAPGMESVADPV